MDWTPVVTFVLGAFLTFGSVAVQSRRHDKSETTKWVREKRLLVYSTFIKAFDECTDALYYGLSEYYDEEIPPDPLPSIGNTRRQFEHTLSELTLLGPANVTELARQLGHVTSHIRNTVGIDWGGDPYYGHWKSVRELRNEYITACRLVLRTGGNDQVEPQELEYSVWVSEWVGRQK